MLVSSNSLAGYVPGDSPMHGLDPRTKALMFAAVVVTATIAGSVWGLVVVAAGVWLGTALCAPSRAQARGLAGLVAVLVAAALVLNSLFTPGRSLPGPAWAPLWPSVEGLHRGAIASLRLVSMACAAFVLVTTTSPRRLGETVESVFGRLSAFRGVGLALDVAGRFLPDFIRDARRVRAIRSVRADPRDTGLTGRAKGAASAVLPLVISAVRRSERLADAMAARCYQGGWGRTARRAGVSRRGDWAALAVTAALCAAALLARGS